MAEASAAKMPRTRVRRYALTLLTTWTVLIGGFVYWAVQQAHRETRTLAESEVRAAVDREKAFRHWLASHGGVYVPVDENTPPNPYLEFLPDRDIRSSFGDHLTLMNPAYAMRQLNERFSNSDGPRGHLTSLKPMNAENAPDAWERNALESFERGESESLEFAQIDGRPHVRLMQPLVTEEKCLTCHGDQGYQEGDVRGGIGVSLPMDDLLYCQDEHIANLAILFGFVWCVGVVAILFGARRIGRSIHGEQRAQEALRENEGRFRTLFEASSDAVMILDETRFVDCNEAAFRLFGCTSKEDFCGRHPSQLSPPRQPDGRDSWAAANEHIAAAIRKGSCHFEWTHQDLHGKTFVADVLLSHFGASSGNMVCATVRDITAKKEATERLRLAAEVASDLIFEWDVSSGDLKWFGDVDTATGFDQEEFPRTVEAWFQRVHPEDQLRLKGVVEKHMACVDDIQTEYRIRRKDDSWISWAVRATPVADNLGRPVKWIGVCTDITEKKQDEEVMRGYTEALESANRALEDFNDVAESATRAKSEFLANMSHEIRTPMTAILGFTEVLVESLQRDEDLSAAATIKRNGEHLLRIINDILDLSKIEAGKLEVSRSPCSPIEVVSNVISLMQLRAETKELSLDVEYIGAIPQTILCDETRLHQILINLTGNAIKFTETGGVRLVVQMVKNAAAPPSMKFDIIDTGIGLTEEQSSRLFQPFTQADSSTSRTYGGTGLGLSISKQLAQRLDGDVTVSSRPGEGSTFSLTVETGSLDDVPMLENAVCLVTTEEKARTTNTTCPVKLDCRVLLAEDSPDSQRLFSFLLKRAGADVVAVNNGRLAFEHAIKAKEQDSPFDVILMDMQMPEMDGYEASRELRNAGYTGPIVALTAHAMKQDQQKCLDAGCDDVGVKPIDQHTLLRLVARHADSENPHAGTNG